MSHPLKVVFIALQAFNFAFLLLHDWIPLGRLSNLAAIRSQDTVSHRLFVTFLGAIPAFVGLFYSVIYFAQPYPHWLDMWLWITYGLLAFGVLRAWWIPCLFLPDAQRAARYQIIFANTHSFLPRRNGIAPDTLHTVFHSALLATLIVLIIKGG